MYGEGSSVSSAIGSLIFLRVPGEVVEKGAIRDFYAEDSIAQTTDQSFVLRFENQGNVHLVPQGTIEITNMWGKVRGKVNINQSSTFGNVLPNSTRKFEFKWHGDANILEIGRYKAEATLVYGTDAKQTVIRDVYFWIVPWKPVTSIIGGFLLFLWFISWSIRRYIRKALELERQWILETTGKVQTQGEPARVKETLPPRAPEISFATLSRPLLLPEVNFRGNQKQKVETKVQNQKTTKEENDRSLLYTWVRHNRYVILFVLILVCGFSIIGWYFVEVFQDERAYQIEQVRQK